MYRSQDRGGNKEAAELAPNSEAFPTSKKTSLFGAIFAGSCLCPRVLTSEAWIKVCACFQAWLLLHFNLRSVPTCILEDNHRPVDLRIARTCCGTLDQQAVWRTGTRVNQAGWYLVRYLDTWITRYINTFCGGESKEHKGCDCWLRNRSSLRWTESTRCQERGLKRCNHDAANGLLGKQRLRKAVMR